MTENPSPSHNSPKPSTFRSISYAVPTWASWTCPLASASPITTAPERNCSSGSGGRLQGKRRFWQPKGVSLRAYGQWRLDQAQRTAFLIIPEGESNCWALWLHRLPGLGLPGSNAAATLEAEFVAGLATVYVHKDPDQGGETFINGVAARLAVLGFCGEAFELRMPPGLKDPADLHAANPDGFKAVLEKCIRAATPIPLGRRAANDGAAVLGPAEFAWEPPIPLSAAPAVQHFPVEVFPKGWSASPSRPPPRSAAP